MSSPRLQPLISAIGQVLLGKEQAVRLALACLLARGHLLIEDLPGMGKKPWPKPSPAHLASSSSW